MESAQLSFSLHHDMDLVLSLIPTTIRELHDQDKLCQKGQAALEALELTRYPCELNVSQYQAISLPESMAIGQIHSDESI